MIKLGIKILLSLMLSFVLTPAIAKDQSKPVKGSPNHLLGAQSPYLQQHIYNAVDWYPWGKEALDKAKSENKPIFLSIGYSTCHWCHVMAHESFENEAIGKFMNENFIAIKVDRERRPDLDNQFMLVTEAITGRGGWPNSLFLTASGKPFFATTYVPPEQFLDMLTQLSTLWKTDQARLDEEGNRISTAIAGYMSHTEAARDVTAEAIQAAVQSIVKTVDEFNGGFGVAPKFPQETALALLLDHAERGDGASLKVVMNALDGMLKGGIHDHVGGGFHRYSTDERWLVPHFEKMLYNQSMIGNILVRAYALSGKRRYKRTAIRLFDYVIREMQDKDGGFYSAQDADSIGRKGEKGEGLFYIWSKPDFETATAVEKSVLSKAYALTDAGNFEGANILHLTELPGDIAKALGLSQDEFYKQLDAGLEKLRIERLNRHEPHKDRKIIVSWNGVMIETLARASYVLDRPGYYEAALKAATYITENMLTKDGLKRASFNGNIGVKGQLSDYAGLGVALLALDDFAPKGRVKNSFMEIIMRLAIDVQQRFGEPWAKQVSAFRMTETKEGIGSFLPLDDNPIPSGNALALKLFDGIAKRTGNLDYKKSSILLMASLSGHALSSPQSRGILVNSVYAVNEGMVGNVRSVAKGNVTVRMQLDRAKKQIIVDLDIKPGWHINSNVPLDDYFIATEMSIDGEKIGKTAYPKPQEKALAFNSSKLSLYEGRLRLTGEFAVVNEKSQHLAVLDIQACSDKICLQPEKLQFNFWAD